MLSYFRRLYNYEKTALIFKTKTHNSTLINFQSLLKTADQLKIKGLCESPEEKEPDSSLPLLPRGFPKVRRVPSPKQHKNSEHRRHKHRRTEKEVSSDKEEERDNKDSVILDNTTDEENDMPGALDEEQRKRKFAQNLNKPMNMSSHALLGGQVRTTVLLKHSHISLFHHLKPNSITNLHVLRILI